jgi:thiol-disulfide isomerase/thioredoxin
MKKLLLFAICSIFYCSYAQLPPNSFGEDFTLTDINGDEFNLHSTLDEGKTVILDLFAVWCGPCWSFAETGVLEDLQAAYPDDVVVVAVEADPSTSASSIYGGGNSVGDWTTIIDYLLMDDPDGTVADDYALAYYPTIYKICPDRMVTEVGQLSSVNAFMSQINSCSSAEYSKDARMLSYNGDDTYCDGSINASVTIQNYSVGATLSACDIVTKANGQEIDTYNWTGSLDTYQTATIDLGTISGIPDNANITFEIDYTGDMDESNNDIDPDIFGSEESSVYVQLNLLLDSYADETSWELFDSNGNVVESTNTVGQAYGAPGDYSGMNNEMVSINWELDPGCYIFQVYDAYGDGLMAAQWGGTDGSVELIDYANNITIWTAEAADWSVDAGAFNAGALSSMEEISETEISIFPNPSKDYINISIHHTTNHVHRHMPLNEGEIEIYNNTGKMVYNTAINLTGQDNNIQLELDALMSGLYYVNVIIDNESNLQPLSIVR